MFKFHSGQKKNWVNGNHALGMRLTSDPIKIIYDKSFMLWYTIILIIDI